METNFPTVRGKRIERDASPIHRPLSPCEVIGARDDAFMEVPEATESTDGDIEAAFTQSAIMKCGLKELAGFLGDNHGGALSSVKARDFRVGQRAREDALPSPTGGTCLFEGCLAGGSFSVAVNLDNGVAAEKIDAIRPLGDAWLRVGGGAA